MNHVWEDQLPYYAAGTLDAAERVRLEKHLDGCESCRRTLREWEMIGGAVRSEAQSWTTPLPPLRVTPLRITPLPGVGVTTPPPLRAEPRRMVTLDARWVAAGLGGTLAAGLLIFVLLGVLIAGLRLNPAAFGAPQGTATAPALTATELALQPTDRGILTPRATATPTRTLEPTATPSLTPPSTTRPTRAAPTISNNAIQPQPSTTPAIIGTPISGCLVRLRPDVARAVVYAFADANSAQIGEFTSGTLQTWVQDISNQWFFVSVADGQGYGVGWLHVSAITIEGSDCGFLPYPTPTYTPTTPLTIDTAIFECSRVVVRGRITVPAPLVRVQVLLNGDYAQVQADVEVPVMDGQFSTEMAVTPQTAGTVLTIVAGEWGASGYLNDTALLNGSCSIPTPTPEAPAIP